MSVTVKTILDEKGRSVVTVAPDLTVEAAARILHENRIGAVVILGVNRKVVGILTERDIVAAVAHHGAASLAMPVSEVMWRNVHVCTEEMTVNTLMEMMISRRARHLPVVGDNTLAGIVSIGDVVKNHIRAIEREAEEIKAYIAG
ncbi:CBS domain-containing protein [Ensifer soli]|uniref:CBS domain-containing protein n=1 Tax=Ciceribacter sp. sgz301302 TaxID=3342379 RepID=UPI0035B82DED